MILKRNKVVFFSKLMIFELLKLVSDNFNQKKLGATPKVFPILKYFNKNQSSSDIKIPFRSEVITESAILKIKAHQNPSIDIPSTK